MTFFENPRISFTSYCKNKTKHSELENASKVAGAVLACLNSEQETELHLAFLQAAIRHRATLSCGSIIFYIFPFFACQAEGRGSVSEVCMAERHEVGPQKVGTTASRIPLARTHS